MLRRLLPLIPLVAVAVAAYFALRPREGPSYVRFVFYRPATAHFYVDRAAWPGANLDFAHGEQAIAFGRPGDIGLACGQDDREDPYGLRVYADGRWYFSPQASRPPAGDIAFGAPGDVPFCADFDGDGRPDSGVFNDGEWFVRTTRLLRPTEIRFKFGGAGDVPVVLNVRGRGNASDRRNVVYGVYRDGLWTIDIDGDGKPDAIHAFGGMPQDRPLMIPKWGPGGARPYSLALFRDGRWYLKPDPDGETTLSFSYGQAGDLPSVVY